MGKHKELIEVLEKAAMANGKQLSKNLDKQLLPTADSSSETAGITYLFKNAHIRKITLLLLFVWFAVYLGYYGLVLNVSNIAGDIYINSVC